MVDTPVWLADVQNIPVGVTAIPQALLRFASNRAPLNDVSDTRLIWLNFVSIPCFARSPKVEFCIIGAVTGFFSEHPAATSISSIIEVKFTITRDIFFLLILTPFVYHL